MSLSFGRKRAAELISASALASEGAVYTLTETGTLNRFDAKTGKQSYKTRIDPKHGFTTVALGLQRQVVLSERGRPTFVIATGDEFRLLPSMKSTILRRRLQHWWCDRLLIRTENGSTRPRKT